MLNTPMKTRFGSKVMTFQDGFKKIQAIHLSFNQQTQSKLQSCILDACTWAIVEVLSSTLSLML
jgi:hypothetical protein